MRLSFVRPVVDNSADLQQAPSGSPTSQLIVEEYMQLYRAKLQEYQGEVDSSLVHVDSLKSDLTAMYRSGPESKTRRLVEAVPRVQQILDVSPGASQQSELIYSSAGKETRLSPSAASADGLAQRAAKGILERLVFQVARAVCTAQHAPQDS